MSRAASTWASVVRLAAGLAASPVTPLAIGLVLFTGGLLLQFSLVLNHDVAWLLIATRRLLAGADVYHRDVVEVNPPLVLYLLAPPVAFSRWLGMPEIFSLRVYVALVAGASLAVCAAVLRRLLHHSDAVLRRLLLALLAGLSLVFITRHYAQREHLLWMLVAPYLLVVAARARRAEVSFTAAVLAGLGGGLAMSLKPHYLVLALALETLLALQLRSLRVWLRPELGALVGVGALYLISIPVFTPEYVRFVVPLALDTYWAYQRPMASLLEIRDLVLLFAAVVAAISLRHDRALRELAIVLLLASVCFYLLPLIQRTGWRYHVYPFQCAAIVLIGLPLLAQVRRLPVSATPRALAFACAAAISGVLLLVAPAGIGHALREALGGESDHTSRAARSTHHQVESAIEREANGGPVYFFTTGLRGVFPAVNEAGVEFASRFPSLWPLPAVVRSRHRPLETPARIRAERMDEIERYVLDAVIEDLEAKPPALVFVDVHPRKSGLGRTQLDFLDLFARDPRFAKIWSHYEYRRKVARFEVYARRSQPGVDGVDRVDGVDGARDRVGEP